MALTTLAGLKAAIVAWATYTDVEDQLDDFIAWAHQEICRRLRSDVLLASADLTINAETIAQPTGFLAFKRVYLDLSPRRPLLTASAEGLMDMSQAYATDQYPTHVATEGTLLRFGPVFTATVTGKALYYKEPDALVDDGDDNVVLLKYPYLYLYGALEALHQFKEDAEMATDFGGKFGALIEDINARDARDSMSGPIQAAPYPGGVV